MLLNFFISNTVVSSLESSSSQEIPLAYISFSLNDNVNDVEYIADDRVLECNSDSENEKEEQTQFSTEQVTMQVN